jgi:hypothetical protein
MGHQWVLALVLLAIQAESAAQHSSPPPPLYSHDAYVGLEPMPSLNTQHEQWYHVNMLQISGNKVNLEKSPVFCKAGQLVWSASDGGFFSYRGSISGALGKQTVTLTLKSCDYCHERSRLAPQPIKLALRFSAAGHLRLGTVKYTKGIPQEKVSCPKR